MTVLFRFAIVFISIFIFSITHATDRSNDTAVLDVDASGEVDALTDGLLLLRSMFGLSDDALTTGVVSPNCVDCDATKISQYITSVEGKTYADLNSTDDQNISGSSFDGTTLTIGIENGQSETVDLSSLEDGTGITAEQASAIEANTAKVGITADQASAITANTAKVGISAGQANAIIANTAKVGITSDQIDAIEENSAKIDTTVGGAVGISFSMNLRGVPTVWKNPPPEAVRVDPVGPYILYTGHDSNNNLINPYLRSFEFINLEANTILFADPSGSGSFPIVEHVQASLDNLFNTPINNHRLPQLGPQSGINSYTHNNFYGFRVPQDGKMVGFQINYIESANTGQFYAMYYHANDAYSDDPLVIFNKGGPIVGNMNSSGPISVNYASGNTLWDENTSIPLKANGFIFLVSDLSMRRSGEYSQLWNSYGPGPDIPFSPPTGHIHATVYVTYD